MAEHQQTQKSSESKSNIQTRAILPKHIPISHPATIIQRARVDPKSLTHADVMQLQRTIGNRAVGKLLIELGLIPSKAKQTQPIQMQTIPEEKEKPLQGKFAEPIQCQEIPEEEEHLQGKFESEYENEICPSCIQRQEIPEEEKPLQTKMENNTGMPDNLKAGVESLSGIDMSNVRVHYNSSKPAEIGALAYTQGANIHVSPGQEQHLPHEAWHVVQQRQGRVKPILQIKGLKVNNNNELEKEADIKGEEAFNKDSVPFSTQIRTSFDNGVIQCVRFRINDIVNVDFGDEKKVNYSFVKITKNPEESTKDEVVTKKMQLEKEKGDIEVIYNMLKKDDTKEFIKNFVLPFLRKYKLYFEELVMQIAGSKDRTLDDDLIELMRNFDPKEYKIEHEIFKDLTPEQLQRLYEFIFKKMSSDIGVRLRTDQSIRKQEKTESNGYEINVDELSKNIAYGGRLAQTPTEFARPMITEKKQEIDKYLEDNLIYKAKPYIPSKKLEDFGEIDIEGKYLTKKVEVPKSEEQFERMVENRKEFISMPEKMYKDEKDFSQLREILIFGEKNVVFRGDDRTPEEIFRTGFSPRLELPGPIFNTNSQDIYTLSAVCASIDPSAAAMFPVHDIEVGKEFKPVTYVYVIVPNKLYLTKLIQLDTAINKGGRGQEQAEIAKKNLYGGEVAMKRADGKNVIAAIKVLRENKGNSYRDGYIFHPTEAEVNTESFGVPGMNCKPGTIADSLRLFMSKIKGDSPAFESKKIDQEVKEHSDKQASPL